jgi:hypothetical protein
LSAPVSVVSTGLDFLLLDLSQPSTEISRSRHTLR